MLKLRGNLAHEEQRDIVRNGYSVLRAVFFHCHDRVRKRFSPLVIVLRGRTRSSGIDRRHRSRVFALGIDITSSTRARFLPHLRPLA